MLGGLWVSCVACRDFTPARGIGVAAPAVPGGPCPGARSHRAPVLAEAEAGMAAGREAPLFQACSFVCWRHSTAASLPAWAGPRGCRDTGGSGDEGCCVLLAM